MIIPGPLLLIAVAGGLLHLGGGADRLRASIRPCGLVMLTLAVVWHAAQVLFDVSWLSSADVASSADSLENVLQRLSVWIACGLGAALLFVDSPGRPAGTGLILLAVAGIGAIAASDSVIWLSAGLSVVMFATALASRSSKSASPDSDAARPSQVSESGGPADHSERLVMDAVCFALILFGICLLSVQTGTLSLSTMRELLASAGAPVGGGLAVATSVLIAAGLFGFIVGAWLPARESDTEVDAGFGAAAARSLLPPIASLVVLLRLFPGLLTAWDAETITVVMIVSLLLIAVGLLSAWLQTGLRGMLGCACVVHAGLWCGPLTAACWEAVHPAWSLVTASRLPGGGSATLNAVACDVIAMLGVWAALSRLAGQRTAPHHPDQLSGLLREHPLTGAVLSLCLLSLCGAPFLAGFWGRFWSLTALFGPRQESSLTGLYEPHYGFLALLAVSAAAQLLLCGLYFQLLQRIVLELPLGRIRTDGGASAIICAALLAGVVVFVGLWPGPVIRAVTAPNPSIPSLPAPTPPGARDEQEPSTPAGGSGRQALNHQPKTEAPLMRPAVLRLRHPAESGTIAVVRPRQSREHVMKTKNSWTRFGLVVAAMFSVTGFSSPIRGDDAPEADNPPAADVVDLDEAAATDSATEVDRLIRALSARDFVARREAEQALISRGTEVVDALAAAAAGGPRETTLRCLEILSRLMRGEDADAGGAAEEALRGLSESEDASLAERARALIEEPADPDDLRPNAGEIRVQIMQQQVVNNRQVSVTEVNGERVVRVKENEREIEIRSRDGKDIRMEVTEEVGGEKKTTEYEADDLDELKEQHPEAAKLYEEFNQQGAGVQVQAFFNVVGGVRGLPLQRRAPPQRDADGAEPGAAAPLLDESIEKLEKIREGLQQNGDEQSVDELVRRLEEVEQQLRAAREKLE